VLVVGRSYHEILQIRIYASGIRLTKRRRARLTVAGRATFPLTRGRHKSIPAATTTVLLDARLGCPDSLLSIRTPVRDDKPYLPDRDTN
jgi:hypothetical protein